MTEVITAQAQRVYEVRQAKKALMNTIQRLVPCSLEWGQAADDLRDMVSTLANEEALLSSLVIEEQLGVFSV